MVESTKVIVDSEAIGRKGMPRFPEAHGREPPTKVVPIDAAPDSPTMTLQEYAAAKRWEKEVGGILVYPGLPVLTDDRSKMLIAGARQIADLDPSFTTKFKFSNENFVEIDAPTIINISNAVLEHVRHCFNLEEEAQNGIADGSLTEYAQIDAIFL